MLRHHFPRLLTVGCFALVLSAFSYSESFARVRLSLTGSALFNYDDQMKPIAPLALTSLSNASVNPAVGLDLLLTFAHFNIVWSYQYLPSRLGGNENLLKGTHNSMVGIDYFLLSSPRKNFRLGLSLQGGLYCGKGAGDQKLFANSENTFSSLVGVRVEMGRESGINLRAGIDPVTRAYKMAIGFHFPLSSPPASYSDRDVNSPVAQRAPPAGAAPALALAKIPISVIGVSDSQACLGACLSNLERFKRELDDGAVFRVVNLGGTPSEADLMNSRMLVAVRVNQSSGTPQMILRCLDLSTEEVVFERTKAVSSNNMGGGFSSLGALLTREFRSRNAPQPSDSRETLAHLVRKL
jgi:hypothetical protein